MRRRWAMNYRERLKNIREDHDMTQAQIGKIIQKSQQGYNHIEMGRAELKIEDLITLCKFYQLSADYIIGISNIPSPFPKK
ncbi:MAG: helix-turn-helix transcriptional regulator [Ruminococcaceae bacterium]|nr:helix-turn-helix transcriptional regulator [Oscillospiraceae bacterium]